MTLTQITEKSIKDGEIVNADINTSAAIAGTKISPAFGANITTTGNAVIGGTTINTAQDKALSIFGTNGSELKLQATNFGGTASDGGAALTCTYGSLFLTNNNPNGKIHFHTKVSGQSTSEKMVLTQDGKLGLGTTAPSAELHVEAATPEIIIKSTNANVSQGTEIGRFGIHTNDPTTPSGVGEVFRITSYSAQGNGADYGTKLINRAGSNSGESAISLGQGAVGAITFSTNTSGSGLERMRIDSSGKIIQRYSADPYDDRALTLQSPSGQTTTALAIVNTETNGQSNIVFGDHAGQNAGNFTGFMSYNHQYNDMRFGTNGGNERLRIQSNGDVYLNPTQGSTGVNSGAIRRFNAGLDYWSGTAGSANAIKYAAHGAADDNMYGMGISNSLLELQSQVDIGFFAGSAGAGTGRRVERARITSNGLTFNGDTAAANALDDYEEGTWTPSGFCDGGSLNVAGATYTKIGQVVYIYMYVSGMNIPNTGCEFKFYGLPYTVTAANDHYPGLTIAYSGGGNLPAEVRFLCRANTNIIYSHTTGGNSSTIPNSTMRSYLQSQALILSGFYFAA